MSEADLFHKQHMDIGSTQPPTAIIVWWRWRCCLLRRSFLKPVRATCTSLNSQVREPCTLFSITNLFPYVRGHRSCHSTQKLEKFCCFWNQFLQLVVRTPEALKTRNLCLLLIHYHHFSFRPSHCNKVTQLQQPTSKGGCEHGAAEAYCQSHGIWSLSTGHTGC